jgi:hypothetical protein
MAGLDPGVLTQGDLGEGCQWEIARYEE